MRRSGDEQLFNSLMEEHHYLGYEQPVGEHLKYLVWANGRPVACVAWPSAPRHIGARDRYIGWDQQARRRNIRFLAYNTRFLILPWVRVPHLASHILGRMAAQLSADWEQVYGHPIYFAETFVDTAYGPKTRSRMARKLDPPNPKFNQELHLRPKLRNLSRRVRCPGNSADHTGDATIVDTAHTSGAPAVHE